MSAGFAVGDQVTRTPVAPTDSTTAREAARIMRGRSIGCLPGRDAQGAVAESDPLEPVGRGLGRRVVSRARNTLARRASRRERRRARRFGT